MEGIHVSGQGISSRGARFWQLAVLAATGTLGIPSQTEAATYYWQDSSPSAVAEPAPSTPVQRAKTHRRGDKKSNVGLKEQAKPQGPLIISISIAQQRLRVYDANGVFAESPVSTGMPGHSTPMGVFSVIQKQKFHQSNIYSGAPMPFMQRITWSGIALHAGVLPGHPASHGCIRMPMAFAVKMYGWTRMGARVIITPGAVTPASFAHPLLASVKVVPQPVAAQETKADAVAARTPQKPEQVDAGTAQATNETRIELRSTVGHVDDVKPSDDESRPTTAKMKTADASGALLAALSSSRKSDAASPGMRDSSKAVAEPGDPNAMKRGEAASAEAKPATNISVEAQPSANDQPAKADTAASEVAKPNDKAVEAPGIEVPKMEADSQAEKPADSAKATAVVPTTAPTAANDMPLKADLKSDFAKSAESKLDLGPSLKNSGQIAVFVSRKDSKLYVRQNFAPLFDVPVTISADDRPLGTHIFTAQVDKNDTNALRWSVVSLPVPAKAASRRADEDRSARGRRNASPIEAKSLPAPDSPAEALDRLSLPADLMARIYEAVSTGGSLIVSDQGIAAGETGEGTDFIVSLR
jgi:lipoprotein-anchoring transpeptidase ErfK/SrfK